MKRIILIVITVCLLFTICGCSSNNDELENDIQTLKNDIESLKNDSKSIENNCDCAKKYIYRKTIYARNSDWAAEEVNLYEKLPENAEVIEIFDTTADSNYPKYDIIYTIHNCKQE